MTETIKNYFLLFLHPISSANSYNSAREGNNSWRYRNGFFNLELSEVILISWVFVFISGIYQLILMSSFSELGRSVYFDASLPDFAESFITTGKQMQVFQILFQAIFFPISAWFYTKLWALVIRFTGKLFGYEEILLYKESREISKNALVSNVFCLVPIFGEVLRHFYGLLHMFFGLKGNLKMSNMQAIIVLLVPVLFVGAWLILMFLNLFMIFA